MTPSTALWVVSVPLWLTVAATLTLSLLLRSHLHKLAASWLRTRSGKTPPNFVDAALYWHPPVITAQALVLWCIIVVQVLLIILSRFYSLPWAGLVASIMVAGGVWIGLRIGDMRYVKAVDARLSTAASAYASAIGSGLGTMQAIERVLHSMPPSPLATEWTWCLSNVGQPLYRGGAATPKDVFLAMQAQTPSQRHAMWLGHLATTAAQPLGVATSRMQAASHALFVSEQRRQAVQTDMAHMLYTGIALACTGIGMSLILCFLLWERVVEAYTSPLGMIAAVIVVASLALPLALGWRYSQVDDLEY